MADGVVHEVVGSTDNPVQGLEAVRRRDRDQLAVTVQEGVRAEVRRGGAIDGDPQRVDRRTRSCLLPRSA